MAEVILVEYRSNVSAMIAEQNAYVGALQKTDAATDKVSKDMVQDFGRVDKSVKEVRTELNNTSGSIQKLSAQSSKSIGSIGTQFASLKNIAASVGPAIGIAFGTEAIVNFAKESTKAASDFNENYSKSEVLFGNSIGKVAKFAENAAADIGQSQNAALEGASTFAVFGRSAGLTGDKLADFSIDLVKLSSDLASFGNTTPEEAVLAVGAALRGESEPIRRYGVLLDEATLRNEAFKLGIVSTTKEALTPQQRVLASQAAIYRQTTAAQGDFGRTSDQLANQQRIVAAQFENVQIQLGQKLLPALLDVTGALSSAFTGDFDTVLSKLDAFSDKVDPIGLGLSGVVGTIKNFNDALKAFEDGDYIEFFESLGESILDLAGTFNPIIGASRFAAERLGIFSDELTEAELIEQRFEARQATFNKAILEGGDALEVFYTKAKDVLGATRKEFDKYVEATRKKLKGDLDDNKAVKDKKTLIELLNKQLKVLGDSATRTIDAGGIVSEEDITKIQDLTKRIQELQDKTNFILKSREIFKAYEKEVLDNSNRVADINKNDLEKQIEDIRNSYNSRILIAEENGSKDLANRQRYADLAKKLEEDRDAEISAISQKNADDQKKIVSETEVFILQSQAKRTKNIAEAAELEISAEKIKRNSLLDNVKLTEAERQKIIAESEERIKQIQETSQEDLKKYYQERNSFLAQFAKTDLEKAQFQYESDLASLQNALDKKLITESEYIEKRRQLYSDFSKYQTQLEMQRAADLLSSISQVIGSVGQIVEASAQNRINKINEEKDAQIAAINDSVLSEGEKSKRIDKINREAARKQYEIQRKQFQANKAISITQTIINTAASVVAQLANPTPFVGIALAAVAAAAGAAQIAVIASQQPPSPPSFFKGTPSLDRGKNPKGKDTIPIMANEGEAIIPTDKNKMYPGLAKAWISGNLEQYVQRRFGAPILKEYQSKKEENDLKKMAEIFSLNMNSTLDDRRIVMATKENSQYLKDIAENTKSQRINKRSFYK